MSGEMFMAINTDYITFHIPKKSGGLRTICAPNPELMDMQKQMLKEIYKTQWVSRKAHGFVKKRGIKTGAAVHVGMRYILTIDVEDFFPSITRNNLAMAKDERDGCCRAIGAANFDSLVFKDNCLPQGAPTSPALSNVHMQRFDTTILPLVRKFVSSDIRYSRYGDDMTFSSNSHAVEKVEAFVRNKLRVMGMKINEKKTRLASRGARQSVTGLNINSGKPTVPKRWRKKVRAIVHRAANGWVITEKQKMYLLGMISHVALCHPEEAKRYYAAIKDTTPVKEIVRKVSSCSYVRIGSAKKKVKNTAVKNGKVWVEKLCTPQRTALRKISYAKKLGD